VGETHQFFQACRFSRRDALPEFSQPIVTAPLIVVGRVRALGAFFDQFIFEHTFDRAVERSRTQAQPAASLYGLFSVRRSEITLNSLTDAGGVGYAFSVEPRISR